jgi:hypothetical protein
MEEIAAQAAAVLPPEQQAFISTVATLVLLYFILKAIAD